VSNPLAGRRLQGCRALLRGLLPLFPSQLAVSPAQRSVAAHPPLSGPLDQGICSSPFLASGEPALGPASRASASRHAWYQSCVFAPMPRHVDESTPASCCPRIVGLAFGTPICTMRDPLSSRDPAPGLWLFAPGFGAVSEPPQARLASFCLQSPSPPSFYWAPLHERHSFGRALPAPRAQKTPPVAQRVPTRRPTRTAQAGLARLI